MSTQNWRTEVDAFDYFGHQRKQLQVADRRPLIRKASDLVGPGIGVSAVPITDFNDQLATYNGYYSAVAGTFGAPSATEAYVGMTVMDVNLGGTQTFVGLDTGYEFTRTFTRNPSDPSSIFWGVWRGTERVPASATWSANNTTSVSPGGGTYLDAPSITVIGAPGTYLSSGDAINVLRQGVYTGYLRVVGPASLTLTAMVVQWPWKAAVKTTSFASVSLASGIWIPFTFWTTADLQQIRVQVQHAAGSAQSITWSDITITRVGDMA